MTKSQKISLDELWNSASIGNQVFDAELLSDRPDLARRYLEQAIAQRPLWGIAPGTPLASAVRLWMHGEIKLGEKWHPFKGYRVHTSRNWPRFRLRKPPNPPILGGFDPESPPKLGGWGAVHRTMARFDHLCVHVIGYQR